ncbi:MAG: alpha/beta hydrolase [Bacteroidetes bacterium]|nr:alpha/beta hydrolase [Bacteroidota bacterium]
MVNIFCGSQMVVVLVVFSCFFSGCSSGKQLTLMPTPVIYRNSTIDPFAHLSSQQKSVRSHVFFATNRVPTVSGGNIHYTNSLDSVLYVGDALIYMGEVSTKWTDLHKSSLAASQINGVPLTLEKIEERASMSLLDGGSRVELTPDMQSFINSINSELATAVDKEIMIYVHGTKVDFANSTILTAEIDHFAGRDFVGVAFAWPSHQNILSYFLGIDVHNAKRSSFALHSLLLLLSEYSNAEHINILSYSAGGKVSSKALYELRQSYAELNEEELKEKFRLGAVVFAAADVEVDLFLIRLQAASELAQQVVVTVTDNDNALKAASFFMGGNVRAGDAGAEKIEKKFISKNHLGNVEIIDVSFGQEERGFDIIGHHYWYRHPWMSSDIIFLMRTDLPPSKRGLSHAEQEGIWYLSKEYPQKVQKAVEIELGRQWGR